MLVFIWNMTGHSWHSPGLAFEHRHGQQWVFHLLNFIFGIYGVLCALFSAIGSASLHLAGLHRHKMLSEAWTECLGGVGLASQHCQMSPKTLWQLLIYISKQSKLQQLTQIKVMHSILTSKQCHIWGLLFLLKTWFVCLSKITQICICNLLKWHS